jgi:hypothetical protein
LALVLKWFSDQLPTSEVRHAYFSLREERMDAGHQYSGAVAEFMSNIDTAMDVFSPNPDPHYSQIDEKGLRQEVGAALDGLRKVGYLPTETD